MVNLAMILKTFFSGFGIPAYAENSVPEEIQLPYITYPLIQPEWDEQASFYVQVWYRKNNLSTLLSKADQITAAIGNGARFDFSGGIIELFTSTPKIQTMTDEDSQRAYINMIIRAYCNPGE